MCQGIILGNSMSCSGLWMQLWINASSDVANFPKLARAKGMFGNPQAPSHSNFQGVIINPLVGLI